MMSSLPQGIHNAVCIGVIFTGINKDKFGLRKKVVLLWEVYVKDEIKTMSREYTFSYDERATLRMHLESWRGGPFTEEKMSTFQIRNILGVPCKLVIQKNDGKKYVQNVLPFPKNEKCICSNTKYIYFAVNDQRTYSDLERVPNYLKEKISRIMSTNPINLS